MTSKASLSELVSRSFIEMMKDVGTSIPGYILAFDPVTQLAQLQIGIEKVSKDGDSFTPAPIIECPVYIFGGSYSVEIEIEQGTEGIILFSQRCIDAWIDSGGVANIPIMRFHDFSDAYFLPGLRSQPNKLQGYSNNGIKLRNKAGDKFIWLKNDGTAEINVNSLKIVGDIDHTGDQITSGTLTGLTEVEWGPTKTKGTLHTHIGSPTAPTGAISPTGAPVP